MKADVFFSVIVPSFQGEKKIGNLITSLFLQDFNDFELLLVIDGSTDNTFSLVEDLLLKSSLNYSIFRKPNSGRGSTRNFGAKQAKGEFLVFFDDDMVLEPECLSAFASFHQQHLNSIAVGRQIENKSWMKTDFQVYKSCLSEKWEIRFDEEAIRYTKDNLHLTAANFSLSKQIFNSLGGFDECLTDVEDFELATRAFHLEIPIYYFARAKAWHNDFITCRSYILRQREYSNAYQKLFLIRPDLVGKYPQTSINKITFTTKAIYWVFSFAFWSKWIDNEVFLIKKLPISLRYKLYDFVVWSQGKVFTNK
jgi:glycosyltransferase involved in cell wall biosynthesis